MRSDEFLAGIGKLRRLGRCFWGRFGGRLSEEEKNHGKCLENQKKTGKCLEKPPDFTFKVHLVPRKPWDFTFRKKNKCLPGPPQDAFWLVFKYLKQAFLWGLLVENCLDLTFKKSKIATLDDIFSRWCRCIGSE